MKLPFNDVADFSTFGSNFFDIFLEFSTLLLKRMCIVGCLGVIATDKVEPTILHIPIFLH